MKSKFFIAAAVCFLLGTACGCEREECQAGVKNGKVEIPEDLAAYFEFKEGSEWVYIEESDSSEYNAYITRYENSVGVGEERTIRCVLGRDIVVWIESEIFFDTIPQPDYTATIAHWLKRDIDETRTEVELDFSFDTYQYNFSEETGRLKGESNSNVQYISSRRVGNKTYKNVLKLWRSGLPDTFYYAKNIGLVEMKWRSKNFRIKSHVIK